MGIKKDEFIIDVDTNLKSNKEATRFYMNFKLNGKRTEKIIDYTKMSWDKRTRVNNAKKALLELKEKIANSNSNININSKLDDIAEMFFKQKEKTVWCLEMISIYDIHIKPLLGNKKVTLIKRVDIDNLKNKLEKKGANKITGEAQSPRSIQKILRNVLKPILVYAYDNEIIDRVPKIETPSVNNKPKVIQNPSETFLTLYKTVLELYKNDPFYKSLFLFVVFGRRQNEVLTLTWEDINFDKKLYIIKKEVNKIKQDQIYDLPKLLEDSLLELGPEKGLIFKSPSTGKKLVDLRSQIIKIKEKAGIEKLTMHMFRNVIASFLASRPEVTPTMIAAALGHVDLQTASKHYITKDHTGASRSLNNILINEIDEYTSNG